MGFKRLVLALGFLSAVAHGASLRTNDSQQFLNASAVRNYVKNSGAEKNDQFVTDASGIHSRTTSSPLEGDGSHLIDASAGSQLVIFQADDFQAGLLGQNCEANFDFSGDGSLYTAYVRLGGTTVSQVVTLTNPTATQPVSINFPCGASTTDDPDLVIASTGDGAAIKVDSVYIGKALNVGTVASTVWLGRKTVGVGSGCNLIKAANNWNNFSDVATCATPTFEGVVTGSDKRPNIVVPYRGAGVYRFKISATIGAEEAGSGSARCGMRFDDGTVQSQVGEQYQLVNKGTGRDAQFIGEIVKTTHSSSTMTVEFQMNRFEGNQSCNVRPISTAFAIDVEYVPSPEQVFRVGAPGQGWTAFTPTNTQGFGTITSANFQYVCAAGPSIIVRGQFTSGTVSGSIAQLGIPTGFTVGPSSAGRFAIGNLIRAAAAGPYGVFAVPGNTYVTFGAGTTSQGDVTGSSLVGSTEALLIEYQVPVTSSSPCPATPMPPLKMAVTTGFSGIMKTGRALLNCDAGSAITTDQYSMVSSIGNISGGACTVTLKTGYFSSTPLCVASLKTQGASAANVASISADATSATSVTSDCGVDTGIACSAYDFILDCEGPN